MKAYVVHAWIFDLLKEKLSALPFSEVGAIMRHLEDAEVVWWGDPPEEHGRG